jgi:hypothetical protein
MIYNATDQKQKSDAGSTMLLIDLPSSFLASHSRIEAGTTPSRRSIANGVLRFTS